MRRSRRCSTQVPKPFLPHNAALRQWPPRVAGTLLTTRVLAVLELQGETTVLRTELAEARRDHEEALERSGLLPPSDRPAAVETAQSQEELEQTRRLLDGYRQALLMAHQQSLPQDVRSVLEDMQNGGRPKEGAR